MSSDGIALAKQEQGSSSAVGKLGPAAVAAQEKEKNNKLIQSASDEALMRAVKAALKSMNDDDDDDDEEMDIMTLKSPTADFIKKYMNCIWRGAGDFLEKRYRRGMLCCMFLSYGCRFLYSSVAIFHI